LQNIIFQNQGGKVHPACPSDACGSDTNSLDKRVYFGNFTFQHGKKTFEVYH